MSEKVKVYITKYALKVGIIEVDAKLNNYGGAEFINPINNRHDYAGKGHWFSDKEKAVVKAEKMRKHKKGLIQLELQALEQLKFD